MKRADVKKDIARVFSQAGFQGKGLEWKYSGKDCDVTLNFDKSNFSDRYSLTVTLDIRSLETKTNTSSHITISGHRLISDPSASELLGDFEIPKEVGNTTRTAAVLTAIERELIPLVLRMTTMDALRSAYKAGGLENALIRKEARAVLD